MVWARNKISKHPHANGYGDGPDRALSRRSFGKNGKRWPVLMIVIYPNEYDTSVKSTGFKVEVLFKKKRDDWWDEGSAFAHIPLEIYDDFLAMLEEAKAKLMSQ